MNEKLKRAGGWLHRRAENIAALMLLVMFVAFIVQVAFRYLLNLPIGGATELTIIMWLWVVLWGAAFVLRDDEEIRFDIVYEMFGRRGKRIMTVIAALAVLFLYGISLPASWDFVTFMKIQDLPYLDIRHDHLFSIYILFAVAVLARYAWILVKTVRALVTSQADEGVSGEDAPSRGDAP